VDWPWGATSSSIKKEVRLSGGKNPRIIISEIRRPGNAALTLAKKKKGYEKKTVR